MNRKRIALTAIGIVILIILFAVCLNQCSRKTNESMQKSAKVLQSESKETSSGNIMYNEDEADNAVKFKDDGKATESTQQETENTVGSESAESEKTTTDTAGGQKNVSGTKTAKNGKSTVAKDGNQTGEKTGETEETKKNSQNKTENPTTRKTENPTTKKTDKETSKALEKETEEEPTTEQKYYWSSSEWGFIVKP